MTAGGVLVGTTAVILLIALTIGLQTAAEAGIGQNASLTEIRVYPNFGFGPAGEMLSESERPELTIPAVRAFWEIPGVAAVIPIIDLRSWAELDTGDFRGGASIMGIDPDLLPYLGVSAEQGSLTLEGDQVLFGPFISQNFYDPEAEEWTPIVIDLMSTPLEMNIYSQDGMSSREYDIEAAGVLNQGTSYDYSMIMPMNRVLEINEWVTGERPDAETFRFDQVIVRATSRETTESVTEVIREMGFGAGGIGDFLTQLNSFFNTMRIVLGGVGGVALLVAAFGVANTMTMAILERTREIGLMKAIGAKDRDVLTVFLVEAGLVGFSGGVAGVIVSYILQNLVNQALANAPTQQNGIMFLPLDVSQIGGRLIIISPELAVFALALATSVGIAAGLYPSLRAARMLTVNALKTE
jgi:putative ABC transport system permease protein